MLTELRRCFFWGERVHASAQGWESLLQPWQLWHGETLAPGLLVPVGVLLCGPGLPLSVPLITGTSLLKTSSIHFPCKCEGGTTQCDAK